MKFRPTSNITAQRNILNFKRFVSLNDTYKYSRTPRVQINPDVEPSGYAENPDYWIFSLQIGYIGSLQFSRYYLQYVPTSKPFDHA
jgi:hypothetical protein